ncbi:MAG: hypothetical protein K2X81_24960 [Candidatus Obscuribacterales bacterium]|nr:hypothetical protein [Candidatus Obscuribacterales bacterium]
MALIEIPACFGSVLTGDEIKQLKSAADRSLILDDYQRLDFRFLEIPSKQTLGFGTDVHHYTCAQVKALLRKDKHKNLLVVRTDWSEGYNSNQEFSDKVRPNVYQFCQELGYKRVVYLGSSRNVWRDTTIESQSMKTVQQALRAKAHHFQDQERIHRVILCPAEDCSASIPEKP